MRLSSLRISLCSYGVNQGKYEGSVEFENESGSVRITLDPSISPAILRLCADGLVTEASKVATLLTSQVLEQASDQAQLT